MRRPLLSTRPDVVDTDASAEGGNVVLNVQFVNAWLKEDWKLEADAKAFWTKLGLISPEERDRR